MKKYYFLLAVGLLTAAPCAAEFKDPAAAQAALKSAAAKDRLDAISYLGAQRTPDSYKTLAQQFAVETDPYLRVQIVERLNVQASTWAYSCALAAAGDKNVAVRKAAVSPLARKVGDAAAYAKLQTLSIDASEAVRLSVAASLSVDTSTSAASVVGRVLSDRKGTIRSRRAAAGILSRMKTPAADDELLRHVSDPDPEIKAAAASRRPGKLKQADKK
jgi:hypothetical protein